MVVLEKHTVVVDHGVSLPEGEIVSNAFCIRGKSERARYGGASDQGVSFVEYPSWSQGRNPAGGIYGKENCSQRDS